jgi:5-methylcytosine-specific restriction endonuclease McrA
MDSLSVLTPMQRFYRRHPERVKASNKAWAKKNPEKRREINRLWNIRNRDKILERKRQKASENREEHLRIQRERMQLFRNVNRDACRRIERERRKRILDDPIKSEAWKKSRAEIGRKYRAKNKVKIRIGKQSLYLRNKHKFQIRSAKRRALKKAATINMNGILEWISRIKSKPSAVCYYCDKRIPTSNIHFDHIVALSNGGAHSVENLCTSCATCNHSKSDKPIRAWIRMGQQILEL